jgi:hypothetical protein
MRPIVIKLTQENVTKVVRGLASQGWQRAMKGPSCAYYDPRKGSRCAVGWLLTTRAAATLGVERLAFLIRSGRIQCDNPEALKALQKAHDNGFTPKAMAHLVSQWCKENGFDFDPRPLAYVDADGKTVNPRHYVHQYRGLYYVAEWLPEAGQFQGPLRGAEKGGATQFYCHREGALPGAGGYVYNRMSEAIRRVCVEYNIDRVKVAAKEPE